MRKSNENGWTLLLELVVWAIWATLVVAGFVASQNGHDVALYRMAIACQLPLNAYIVVTSGGGKMWRFVAQGALSAVVLTLLFLV